MNKNTKRQHILRTPSWTQKKKQLETVDSMKFILANVSIDHSEEMPSLHEVLRCDENTPEMTMTGKVKAFLHSLFGRCWSIY